MDCGTFTPVLGIDLGTTNTVLATQGQPVLTGFGRDDAPELIPTVLQVREETRWFRKRLTANIGRHATDRHRPEFVAGFKTALMRDAQRTVAYVGRRRISARDALNLFVSALPLAQPMAFAVPVGAYELYRRELYAVAKCRFIDEPLAAALGYGLETRSQRSLLVVDCGGGTMHASLVRLSSQGTRSGGCTVMGKAMRSIGGDTVDAWLLEQLADDLPLPLSTEEWVRTLWRRHVLDDIRKAKEAVYAQEATDFVIPPPDDMLRLQERKVTLTRTQLHDTLHTRGFFAALDKTIDEACTATPDDVLLVGGSTLLPGFYAHMCGRFGRERVRAWQPFTAVAMGAAAYAAGAFVRSDFIVHDYAIVTHDLTTHAPHHTVIVPRGTPVPSDGVVWQRALVPTCVNGAPEAQFKLVVSEIGGNELGRCYDAAGNLYVSDTETRVVALNAHHPTLGKLNPPHAPSDKRPRLDVRFSVDADRWLRCTVRDLMTEKDLLSDAAVVRLL